MHALTRPCLPPAWAPPRGGARLRSSRLRLARARRCALLTPLALDPASLAAAVAAAIGGMSEVADKVTPDNAAAAVAGAVSLSAAAMSARDALADGGDGDGGAGGNGNGSGGGGGGNEGGGGGGGSERWRDEGDFWHRNALPSFACALVTAALLRAHEDAAAAAFGWASFALLLLPLPFTVEVGLVAAVFVYIVRRRALSAAAEDK